MTKSDKNNFHYRSFTSFIVLITFLFIAISGIFLYFAPPGRVAHWSLWTFLGLTKTQWQAIHTICAFGFIISSAFHLYFNWSILMGYLKKKMERRINRSKELIGALLLTGLIVVLTLVEIPPFSTIMDWGEALSDSWSNENTEPPIPHAELMTLPQLAESLNIPLEQIMTRLKKAGMEPVAEDEIIQDIAARYDLTPNEVYSKIKPEQQTDLTTLSGAGWGRKTVTQVCDELDIPMESGLANLMQNSIEANADDTIRDLALDNNLVPVDVVELIKKSK